MRIVDSSNGGFLQPSLFLKAFEKLKGSRTHRFVKSSWVFFFNFHRFHRFSFAEESLISLKKSRFVVGLFAENLLNFFPRVDRVNSEYRSTHPSPTDSGRV